MYTNRTCAKLLLVFTRAQRLNGRGRNCMCFIRFKIPSGSFDPPTQDDNIINISHSTQNHKAEQFWVEIIGQVNYPVRTTFNKNAS